MSHRRFVRACLALCTALSTAALSLPSRAQDYPARPIRILVGYAPGGSTDSIARVLALNLQERLTQPVVVENRPGASSQIATEALIKSAADGYTLQMASSDLTALPGIRKRAPWNVSRDFTLISRIALSPLVYVVNNQVPVKNLGEFVAYVKAHPGAVRYGSPGTGSILHLVGELLKVRTGIVMTHVPYKGGAPVIQDLLGGQIEMGVVGPVDVAGRMGQLRPLAQAGRTRHPAIPQVPTTAESGLPEVIGISTFTLVGPANLPRAVRERLNKEIVAIAERPDFRQKVIDAGSQLELLQGPALEQYILDEGKRWADIARTSQISLDE